MSIDNEPAIGAIIFSSEATLFGRVGPGRESSVELGRADDVIYMMRDS